MEAAFNESVGNFSKVFREPTFRSPRGSDVKSDDRSRVGKVRTEEDTHITKDIIWDKNF